MAVKFSNNAATLLAANASTSTTLLTVDNGSIFPTLSGTDHTYVTLEDVNANREVVKVTAISGNTLTVVRAQDGTTARAFSTADKCELRITAALLNDLNTDADTESVSIAGDTMTGNLSLGDNVKLQLGNQTNGDLQIYHSGTNSFVSEIGSGDLKLNTNGASVILQKNTGEPMVKANTDSSVDLYYDNAKKLATTSTGTLTTGTSVVSTSMMIGSTDSPSRDLEIKTTNPHIRLTDTDASGSYTEIFGGSGITTINADKGQNVSGSVLKLSVDATDGITIDSNHNVSIPNGNLDVTGSVVADGLTVDGDAIISGGSSATNTGATLQLESTETAGVGTGASISFKGDDGTGSQRTYGLIKGSKTTASTDFSGGLDFFTRVNGVSNATKRIAIASNGDISFYEDTGTTAKVFWDASTEKLTVGGSLQFFNNGSSSVVDGGDNLRLRATNNVKIQNFNSTETMAEFVPSGAVTLRHANSPKLATTSTGISISNDANFPDNGKAIFGAGDDLEIYSDGTNGVLKNTNGNYILLDSDNLAIRSQAGSNRVIVNSSGINVTGSVTSTTGFTTGANTRVQSSSGMLFVTGAAATVFEVGAGSEKMRLLSTGLGIGDSNPSYRLDVNNTSSRVRFKAATGNSNLELSAIEGRDYLLQSLSDGRFRIYDEDASAERLTINADGSSVFSGSVTSTGLTVENTSTSTPAIKLSGNNAGQYLDNIVTSTLSRNNINFVNTDTTDSASNGGQLSGSITFETSDANNAGVNAFIASSAENSTGSGRLVFGTGTGGTVDKRMNIASNGDISFYEDTGTTPKFFWDASTERLGLGVTNPLANLDISSATTSTLRLSNTDTILTENQVTGQLEFYQSDASNNGTGITGKIGMRSVPQKPAGGNYYGNVADMDFYVSGQLNGYANDNASLKAMTIQAGSGNATFSGSVTAGSNGLFKNTANANGTTLTVADNANRGITITSPIIASAAAGRIATSGTANSLEIGVRDYPTAMAISGSTGNINIGSSLMVGATTAPSAKLDVQGGLAISNSSASYWTLDRDNTDGSLTFTDSYINEAMRINSSGALLLHPNNIGRGLKITTGTGQAVGSDTTYDTIAAGYGQHIFKTDGTERMRLNADGSCRWTPDGTNHDMTLTADGNLLVGTTDTDTQNNNAGSTADNGFAYNIGSGGYLNVARYGGTVAYFNRTSTDGTIADFRKDGTSVGSIASDGGSNLIVKGQGNNAALLFNHTNARIEPYTNSVTDLGRSAAKFKDLYLSDTVYAGVRVCIGTTETPRPLTVNGLAGFRNSTTGFATSDGFDIGVGGSDAYIVQRENANIIIETNGTEAARIDASQNLLVGKTSTSGGVVGTVLASTGLVRMTASSIAVAEINRINSDGSIVDFKRDGSTVGSIGTSSGSMYIEGNPATGKSGLTFYGSYIEPRDNGSPADNAIDLGGSTNRFKDLYLSSGVYLGGTGSANKLDDYEEGTFTATLKGSSEPASLVTSTSYYTKVGNKVHFEIGFENADTTGYSGNFFVTGLPFASTGPRAVASVIHYKTTTWSDGHVPVAIVGSGQTQVDCLNQLSGSSWAVNQHSAGTGRYFWITGTYITTS